MEGKPGVAGERPDELGVLAFHRSRVVRWAATDGAVAVAAVGDRNGERAFASRAPGCGRRISPHPNAGIAAHA